MKCNIPQSVHPVELVEMCRGSILERCFNIIYNEFVRSNATFSTTNANLSSRLSDIKTATRILI